MIPALPYANNFEQGPRSRGTLDDISDDESQDEIPTEGLQIKPLPHAESSAMTHHPSLLFR
jgi:hypothetical protein